MHYKNFGKGSGLRVSEIVLGCGNFGTRWGYGAEPQEAKDIFNLYADNGGNFLDTADSYQLGQSEELIGEFLKGRRNEFVLSSKFTLGGPGKGATGTGNSRQVMIASLEASLKRLKTDRIDLYWVHMPDGITASDEIMRAMDDLVRAGKINYIGFSDFPAWRIARAATIAEIRGWAPVIAVQMEYSLVERTSERDLIPMANALGLGMVGWSPLGGGLLTGKYRRGEEGRANTFKRLIHSEDNLRKTNIMDALVSIASELEVTPGEVALAWISSSGVLPIIGPRTARQLKENIASITVQLSYEHIKLLTSTSAITLGFPHDFLANSAQRSRLSVGQEELNVNLMA